MKKRKEPILIPALLRILQGGSRETADLLDIFLSGYGESYKKIRRKILYPDDRFRSKQKDWGEAYIELQRFYALLGYLKKQGIVGKDDSQGRKHVRWSITRKGSIKLEKEEGKPERYRPEKDPVFRVIIFDIPETMRAERDWLREALRQLGFSFLQGSVWVGKRKVPEKFLYDLRKKKLLRYVHIFEVEKEGTIIQ